MALYAEAVRFCCETIWESLGGWTDSKSGLACVCTANVECSVQIKKGEVFVSETDTEVIPKLCQYIYSSSQEKVPFHEVRREWCLSHLMLIYASS